MTKLTKFLLQRADKQKKYFESPLKYAQKIKKISSDILPQAKIYLFGSSVYGKAVPGSDIDLLVVSAKIAKKQLDQAKIKVKLYQTVGKDAPFEIHLTTPKGLLWYKQFAKNMIEV